MMKRLLALMAVVMMVTTAMSQGKTDDADKVTEDRMNKGLVTSSIEALAGQAAGAQVSTGGNQKAMVSAVRVRGTTSLTGGNNPLVIIDGVTSDLATLSTIYPSDLESFTILKDASETAQYGSGLDGDSDFNAVRKRVGMPLRKLTLDNLLDERLLELCWEGWRRQDLIRFGKYKSLYEGETGEPVIDESDGHTTLYPIPADVLIQIPELEQTPGY